MKKLSPGSKDLRFPDPQHVSVNRPADIDLELSVETLLEAYRLGYYPKPEDDSAVLWWCPDPRTVLFLDEFKASKSLRKSVRNRNYHVTLNKAFESVVNHCAYRPRPSRRHIKLPRKAIPEVDFDWLMAMHEAGMLHLEHRDTYVLVSFSTREDGAAYTEPSPTWITPTMIAAYLELHHSGHAHSVETWHDQQLVGGLYGVTLGGLFCGESMFSHQTDASKVALYHLVGHLKKWKFDLIDCQEPTELLFSLGAREVSRSQYLKIINRSTARQIDDKVWQSI